MIDNAASLELSCPLCFQRVLTGLDPAHRRVLTGHLFPGREAVCPGSGQRILLPVGENHARRVT